MIPDSLCFQLILIEFRALHTEILKEGSQNFEALIPPFDELKIFSKGKKSSIGWMETERSTNKPSKYLRIVEFAALGSNFRY